eukprot:gene20695-biopygen1056
MSWVGPHAIRPRNHTPGGDDFSPIICLGLGPQLCLRPRPVARARIPEGRAPFYGPNPVICLGLGPQLYGPEPIARARNHTPGGDDPCPLYGPICLGLGPQLYVPAPWPIG